MYAFLHLSWCLGLNCESFTLELNFKYNLYSEDIATLREIIVGKN